MTSFYISVAAGFGAVVRLAIMDLARTSNVLKRIAFPLSTFFINIVGTLLIAIAVRHLGTSNTEQIIAAGFLGGFTTFSTLTNEMIQLWRGHRYWTCVIYVVITYASSSAAIYCGYIYL
ncbi:fluoride efflux transporter FluC [Paucilactobacillus wasatchensis]|uniref:Fluoride-specific ion channel FluC n=1 Tax=Paucilactobacillus wasatchensis TaxID=1335616 RepID=A0A0D0YV96_9LACO|nr:CrcB family protein [Paucilactobacillus wasatchensis]KIS03204.1 CrcB like protein [Paucilactobacillus wasatchensis]